MAAGAVGVRNNWRTRRITETERGAVVRSQAIHVAFEVVTNQSRICVGTGSKSGCACGHHGCCHLGKPSAAGVWIRNRFAGHHHQGVAFPMMLAGMNRVCGSRRRVDHRSEHVLHRVRPSGVKAVESVQHLLAMLGSDPKPCCTKRLQLAPCRIGFASARYNAFFPFGP